MGRSRVDAAGATVGRHGCVVFGLVGIRCQPAFVNKLNERLGARHGREPSKVLTPSQNPPSCSDFLFAGAWSCVLTTTHGDVNRRNRRQRVGCLGREVCPA